MQILRTPEEVRLAMEEVRLRESLGFVATMGGLHAGHEALIKASVSMCRWTIVSIFVNPAQFAPHEDFGSYPRTLQKDTELCKELGVDFMYCPAPEVVYPEDYCTFIETDVGKADKNPWSEGAARPTFFRGVATVLTKLFILIRPTVVFFGQKDAQQCAVVRRLVKDLWLETSVHVCDIVRESDGLALSTRNAYLTPLERKHSPVLYEALCKTSVLAETGIRDPDALRETCRAHVEHWEEHVKPKEVAFELVYVSVCSATSMKEYTAAIPSEDECLVCIAAMMGKTRLIDNICLKLR